MENGGPRTENGCPREHRASVRGTVHTAPPPRSVAGGWLLLSQSANANQADFEYKRKVL